MLPEGHLMNVPSYRSSQVSNMPCFVFKPSQPIRKLLAQILLLGGTQKCFPEIHFGESYWSSMGGAGVEEGYSRCGPWMGPPAVCSLAPKGEAGTDSSLQLAEKYWTLATLHYSVSHESPCKKFLLLLSASEELVSLFLFNK